MQIFKHNDVIKIVAIGPESTGKSTLCSSLATQFATNWCKEYARAYLLENGTAYSFDDLLTIAEGQLKLEEEATDLCIQLHADQKKEGSPILFIDTDMYVMKVWCEFVFGKCHPKILNQIVQRKYDGYLLCKPDLPWVKDELREYPDLVTRETLYHHYKDLLVHQSTPWFEVTGKDPERMEGTVKWIQDLINQCAT
jgi:NadR type nicotinamide-nucleotide adenylyltransferase